MAIQLIITGIYRAHRQGVVKGFVIYGLQDTIDQYRDDVTEYRLYHDHLLMTMLVVFVTLWSKES